MADPVPKPPALDAKSMADGWGQLKKPDGSPYTAYGKWTPWKQWADKLRDYIETNRIAIQDQKVDLDAQAAQIKSLNVRVKALEDAPSVPFPGSG